ncbi:MAG: hypothetical protein IPK35_17645 [Saprospiraceae bacterium]|jgi:hypothetical protein|nr:hypothetical protein [Saprospiraceae bacterium]
MRFKFLLLGFVFFIGFKSDKMYAQYSEIGFGWGASTYWGDLNAPSFTTNVVNNSGMALQLHYRKIFQKKFGAKASLVFGKVKGSDSNSSLDWQNLRNLSFKSSLVEGAVMGEYYIFGYDMEEGSSVFLPYATIGFCGFRFDPTTIYRGNEVRLQPLGTEGQGMPGFGSKYNLLSAGLCFGGGAKFILSETINLGIEVVMRRTFTDYLDDVSTNYVNYDDLSASNGVLAANLGNRMNEFLGQSDPIQLPTGSVRGGASVKDYYLISTITVNVLLADSKGRRGFGKGSKVICPKF